MKKIYILIIFAVLLFMSFLLEMYIDGLNLDYLTFVPTIMCIDGMFRKKFYSKYGELPSYTIGTLVLVVIMDGLKWDVLVPDMIRVAVGAALTFAAMYIYYKVKPRNEEEEKKKHMYDELFKDK